MTTVQWLFHYLEICHHQKRDFKLEIEKLRAGSADIRKSLKYLMIVTEPDRGRQAVEAIEEDEANRYKDTDENEDNKTNSREKALNNEDQELWDWMQTTPEVKALPKQVAEQVHDRKFVVEAKSLSDVMEDLGLIGINENTSESDEVVEVQDESTEANTEINDEQTAREPVRIQSIGSINEEEIPLGFEME